MRFHDERDADLERYHAVSGMAVFGAVLAVLSAVVMVEPRARFVWMLPAAGIIFNGWALVRISRLAPALAGRKLALAGLFLSILFGVAAPVAEYTFRQRLRREACQVADAWFRFLAEGHPEKAFQINLWPGEPQPLDDNLWSFYRKQPRLAETLKAFVAPSSREGAPAIVRTLLALGPRAKARYYRTASERYEAKKDTLILVYAVTYDDDGKKASFLVGLELARRKLSSGEAQWQLADYLRSSDLPDVTFRPPGG